MSKSIVHIFGGMGNQMFQYVFYLKLKSEGKEIFINIDFFKYKYSKREHAQKFILRDAFVNIDAPVFSNYMSKVIYSNQIQWRVYKIIRKLFFLKKRVVQTFDFVTSQNIGNIDLRKKTLHYRDYWIDTKYFIGIEEVVRRSFGFKEENFGVKNRLLLREMEKRESVSIHVRRGDYLTEPFLSKFCQPDYYEKAIQIIKEKYPAPYFYIFSDDIEWCKNNFMNLGHASFIDWNTGERSYLDMMLISNCKHNIIAASTFSWWGAWLNSYNKKTVILPHGWFMSEKFTSSVMEGWIRI